MLCDACQGVIWQTKSVPLELSYDGLDSPSTPLELHPDCNAAVKRAMFCEMKDIIVSNSGYKSCVTLEEVVKRAKYRLRFGAQKDLLYEIANRLYEAQEDIHKAVYFENVTDAIETLDWVIAVSTDIREKLREYKK